MAHGFTAVVPTEKNVAVRVTHSVNQSISTGTNTIVAFDTERWDTDSIHDNVTNNSRLTAVTAGKYVISTNIQWQDFGSSKFNVEVHILLNGSTKIAESRRKQRSTAIMSLDCVYDLGINDYVEVRVKQDTGSSKNVIASAQRSPEFMMQRIA